MVSKTAIDSTIQQKNLDIVLPYLVASDLLMLLLDSQTIQNQNVPASSSNKLAMISFEDHHSVGSKNGAIRVLDALNSALPCEPCWTLACLQLQKITQVWFTTLENQCHQI
ncbi:hypothetical protein V6Z12_A05G354500 [Gossypium hirsutum]